MTPLERILGTWVGILCDQELLVLVPTATREQLVGDLIARMKDEPVGPSAGDFLARALIESPYVDEVYADDRQLMDALSSVEP